jgi:hypothetical protein
MRREAGCGIAEVFDGAELGPGLGGRFVSDLLRAGGTEMVTSDIQILFFGIGVTVYYESCSCFSARDK